MKSFARFTAGLLVLLALVSCKMTPAPVETDFSVTVTNAGDGNQSACTYSQPSCSLREAINKANHFEGSVVVQFNISPGSTPLPIVIRPGSPLPTITNTVVIDGTTQAGYSGSPVIELDGSLAGESSGLIIQGDGSSVRGLAINRFARHGIDIQAQDVSIFGNYIGTDAAGTVDRGNGMWGVNLMCGDVQPKRATIGGPGAEYRNVISGNNNGGIRIDAEYCESFDSSAWIRSNYIGTNAAGDAALGNTGTGIRIEQASLNMIGGLGNEPGNVISANSGGVEIEGGNSTGNTIRGNTIGTNAAGDAELGNWGDGISTDGTDTLIGGTVPGSENLISGNGGHGIQVFAGPVTIEGNVIGLNRMGTAGIGNTAGINVAECTTKTLIGGGVQSRNVISGNAYQGIRLYGRNCPADNTFVKWNYIGTNRSGTAGLGNQIGIEIDMPGARIENNLISGNESDGILLKNDDVIFWDNFIGTDAEGSSPLSNGNNGVLLQGAASGNSFAFNRIAFNGRHGLAFLEGSGTGNRIRSNSIHDNKRLGIALGGDAVLPNDHLDVDAGPNGLQNSPVLTTATVDGDDIHVLGELRSRPNTSYAVDFYFNNACDPSGHGEGEVVGEAMDVTTLLNGTAIIDGDLNADVYGSYGFLTALAVDPDGSTSEFSNCIPIAKPGTATPQTGGIKFLPAVTPAVFFFGRCEPVQVEISLEIANPPEAVDYVLLFVRSMDSKSFEKTAWSEGLSMIPAGKGKYRYTLSAEEVPDFNKFPDAILQYQFVAYNKSQAVIDRSEVFGDVALRQCGVIGPAVTPTPAGVVK